MKCRCWPVTDSRDRKAIDARREMWLDMNLHMKVTTEMNDIINRHIARTMTDLEEAGCPVVFKNAVKSNLQWLRSDLNEMNRGERHERPDNH